MKRCLLGLMASCVPLAACADLPPHGQVVVHVDTDAPVPSGPGEVASPDEPPPLFDRVRFDVLPPAQPCDRCTGDFAVSRRRLETEGLSMGVVPGPGEGGYRVRVRLYREELEPLDEPAGRTVLDSTILLPAVGEGQVAHVNVFLPTEEVGQPRGTPASPSDAEPGAPGPSRVGEWSGAQRVACGGAPAQGEVCIPGGAFWMGHPWVPGGEQQDDAPAPRLVVLSPFFLDAREIGVRELRQWLTEHFSTPPPGDPARRLPPQFLEPRRYCTLPEDLEDDSFDELPLNCIGYALAREFCKTRDPARPDADLPTEAQLEYAAGALESRLHVWGRDEPGCADAVFARSSAAIDGLKQYAGDCRYQSSDPLGGSEKPGTGVRDRLFDGTLLDLAGNLAELARDGWSPQAGDCWTPSLLRDPVCTAASKERVVKGGSWASEPHQLRAAYRASVPDHFGTETDPKFQTNLGPLVGFRCSRPAPLP